MTNPNPAYASAPTCPPPDLCEGLDFDPKDWIMRNIYLNDPVELRRDELRGWAEAAGFVEVDVRNLGQPDFWDMRFNRGTNPVFAALLQRRREIRAERRIAMGSRRISRTDFCAAIDWLPYKLRMLLRHGLPRVR